MSSDLEMLNALKNFDTPSITNVVATYPKNPLCLGLYNPWSQNWYTDASLRCWYPELGRVVGYAVTCVYGLPDPNYSRAWSSNEEWVVGDRVTMGPQWSLHRGSGMAGRK